MYYIEVISERLGLETDPVLVIGRVATANGAKQTTIRFRDKVIDDCHIVYFRKVRSDYVYLRASREDAPSGS